MGVKVREKKKGSGEWWLIIHRDGRKVTKRIGNKKAAERAKKIVEGHLAAGRAPLPERKKQVPTLAEYFCTFERNYVKTALRETTQNMYDVDFRLHILPKLGSKHLDQITRSDVEEFIAHLVNEKRLAHPTIRIAMSHLTACLNHAIDHGIISANPTKKTAKYYKQAPVRHEEIQPLNENEVRLFLQTVLQYSPDYYPLFLCAIHTGMRSGELAALQWGDIDFNSGFLTVRRQYVWGKVIPFTKTNRVHRVDLSKALMSALQDLKRRRREQWLEKGKNEIPDWVLCNREGNPPDMQNVKNRHFYRCLEKAGLRRIRFHDLRHTFASLLLTNRESLTYVKEQLGHSSITMTVDTYGHLVPGANRKAMDRLPTEKKLTNEEAAEQEIKHHTQ